MKYSTQIVYLSLVEKYFWFTNDDFKWPVKKSFYAEIEIFWLNEKMTKITNESRMLASNYIFWTSIKFENVSYSKRGFYNSQYLYY